MAELHSNLEKLGPVDYANVPLDDLVNYMKSHLAAGELICNSVPVPPDGDSFDISNPTHSSPNLAASSKDIASASARYPPTHDDHTSLSDSWGKPVKIGAKENPLDVKVYKMAGHDRHGAWFARRSVHEGLSFTKFRNAIKWEFLESLATQGGPGAGAVRGIGVDKRLEDIKVDEVGKMQVYQLSAQFPGPTTPRDFVVLLMTSDSALSDKSSADGTYIPRHYMILSKPVTHPESPDRSGYIRGHYESVEMIREVPLHKRKATSNGESSPGQTDKSAHDEELNPVEWIMVTRSDPGGGIPRFMVDRGTPASITNDVVKFFDWACKKDDLPDADEAVDVEKTLEQEKSNKAEKTEDTKAAPEAVTPVNDQSKTPTQGGYLQSAQGMLRAGLDAYAPAMVANAAHPYLPLSADHSQTTLDDSDSSDSDSSSTTSYASAADFSKKDPLASTDSLARSDSVNSRPSTPSSSSQKKTQHEKELAKLENAKSKLETKLAKKREQEAARLKSQESKGASSTDLVKLKEKSKRDLEKSEEKHAKEVSKLEDRRKKELDKARRKRQKLADRDVVQKLTRERDDFRARLELVQRENELLREQIGEVQRENSVLVRSVGRMGGGDKVLEGVREELRSSKGRVRSESRPELWK